MKKPIHLLTPLAFLALLTVAVFVGRHVQDLRKSEAFYRWVLATAVHERMGWGAQSSPDYMDDKLYAEVAAALESRLPDVPLPEDAKNAQSVSRLGRLTGDRQQDAVLWTEIKASSMYSLRGKFLDFAKLRKLEYAKDIQYVDAMESGVNVFNLFFGFRKVAANFLWIQVDRYWHQGSIHRMILTMKTVVTLDPNFVEAYLIGAWHISYNATASMMDTPPALRKWHPDYKVCIGEKETYYYLAIDFLKDGIRKNPRDYKLYFDLGYAIYKEKLKDYPNAIKYLSEAVRVQHDRWVERQLPICQELNGQFEDALAGWQAYVQRFPDTTTAVGVAPRFMERNRGRILERMMDEALKVTLTSTDPAAIAKGKADADNYRAQALDIWKTMLKTSSDPYAEARISRIQAQVLATQGRYLEAISLLDKARFSANELFDEMSNTIIALKEKGGIPLTLSEQKAVLRDSGAEHCQGEPETPVK